MFIDAQFDILEIQWKNVEEQINLLWNNFQSKSTEEAKVYIEDTDILAQDNE
jgi:hypothetical protein